MGREADPSPPAQDDKQKRHEQVAQKVLPTSSEPCHHRGIMYKRSIVLALLMLFCFAPLADAMMARPHRSNVRAHRRHKAARRHYHRG